MPRPLKHEKYKRTNRVTLNFDSTEWKQIQETVRELNISLPVYLRTKCLKGRPLVPRFSRIDADNMNQLARLGGLLKSYFNETGGQNADLSAEVLHNINGLISLIRKGISDDRETYKKPEDSLSDI